MRFIIVGGGVAGITAAMDLARRKVGEVHVYSDEEYPYYYRPQLTEFLAGSLSMNDLLRRPLSWYEGRGIQVHLGQHVMALCPEQKMIALQDGTQVSYDKLLLATGSVPFTPPVTGSDKKGVRTWRTLEDTLEMEKAALICQRVIILGGGLLGLEAARGLRGFCSQITVLEFFPRLMPRQLDVPGSALLQQFVESLGVEVVVGAQAEEILGNVHVTGVRLKSGREFPAQTVLCAAGVRSNVWLAQAAGLRVERGVVVDNTMLTSVPDIYAAGDVAVYKGYNWAIAPIAQAQARIAAANMAGESTVYDVVVPSTTLKVVGIDVASVGIVNPEEDEDCKEVRFLDEEAGIYKKIVLQDGIIVGAIVINDKVIAKQLEQKIAKQESMTLTEARALL
ncbi:MAG: NAD(P)/FAD-dependent oxidoreductase [Anaerolineae bacterium]|nr:NAD(P)/FAD-dependent oxidoreductase [Anaerolineae bacterium]